MSCQMWNVSKRLLQVRGLLQVSLVKPFSRSLSSTSHPRCCEQLVPATKQELASTSLRTALFNRDLVGRRLRVQGWIKGARKQKDMIFLDIDDGLHSGQRLQIVIDKNLTPLADESILRYHASVSVEGTLRRSQHPSQEVEIVSESIRVLGSVSNSSYPFAPRKIFPADHTRQFPMLRAKLNDFAALLRTRNTLSQSIHEYFQKNDFVQIQTPILTSNDCEGAGEVFEVRPALQEKDEDPYFSHKVFLTVSGQLHLEAVCNGISKVYNFSPVFRAERGRSRRHLTEFSMVEAELAFVEDISDILQTIEGLLKYSLVTSVEKSAPDIAQYTRTSKENNQLNIEKAIMNTFIVISYDEAFKVLDIKSSEFKSKFVYGQSFGKEHELYLVEKYCNNIPVFVVEWPKNTKPFYARACKDKAGFVDACDLIFPGIGELVGGSLREANHDVLVQSVREAGIDIEALQWYLDMRYSGAAPTGGFGLGFERLLQFLLLVNNIKDTLPFPRTSKFCLL